MTKKEKVINIIKSNGGIAKTSELIAVGINNNDIAAICSSGDITRVRHGFYTLTETESISEAQLIAKTIPEGIVCVESALFYYGYNDFSPRAWTIAVPRNISRKKLDINNVFIKAYYVQDKFYALGQTTLKIDDTEMKIYDRERTLCDCFKYRTKLDSELFNKTVHAYVADENKSLANLSKYAKEMGLYTKVMNVMEVLLNG